MQLHRTYGWIHVAGSVPHERKLTYLERVGVAPDQPVVAVARMVLVTGCVPDRKDEVV